MRTAVAIVIVTVCVIVLLVSWAPTREIQHVTTWLLTIDRKLIVASCLIMLLTVCSSAQCSAVTVCFETTLALARPSEIYGELRLSEDRRRRIAKKLQEFDQRFGDEMRSIGHEYETNLPAPPQVVARSDEIGKALEQSLAEALTPKQMERFKQIQLQASGFAAFLRPEVQRSLNLSGAQKRKARDFDRAFSTITQEIVAEYKKTGNRELAAHEMKVLDRGMTKEILNSLNEHQRRTWAELTGKEVRVHEFPPAPRFG
jgi:hypothetical protein